jgi:Tol biopolymer transport system component
MKRFAIAVALIATMTVALSAMAPAYATAPGKNGRIAFLMDRGHGSEIYTMRHDGTELERLTHMDGDAVFPDWSPDGRRIAFWLADEGLYVMHADGTHLHEVTAPGGSESFTPDGHHLVYENARHRSGIFLMRADGSDAPGRRLSRNPFPHEGDVGPQVSPNGKTVTFLRAEVDGELQALFAVNRNGTHRRLITPYDLAVSSKHDWAPDGSRLLVTQYADHPDGHTPNVATIRPDGSGLRQLTHQNGPDVAALAGSYSPDGRWIVFRLEDQRRGKFALWKMHPNGSHRTRIIRMRFAPRFIDWGPRPS